MDAISFLLFLAVAFGIAYYFYGIGFFLLAIGLVKRYQRTSPKRWFIAAGCFVLVGALLQLGEITISLPDLRGAITG